MPRVARFKVAAVEELYKQLRYAPPSTRKRQMDHAESLVAEIDRSVNYPEDFIVYRITGYRPDNDNATMLVGEALLPDLVNFVLRISRDLDLPPDYNDRNARLLPDIATELNISTKTLERYRKKGLVCHYVTMDDGHQLLACFEDALHRYIREHDGTIKRAAGFTRITARDERELIAQARSLRTADGATLNEAAAQLAQQHGRAHETVRMLLRRHDRSAAVPIFIDPIPLRDREARLLYRAWRYGAAVALMSERLGKTTTTIHRAINRQRGLRLSELDLNHVTLPTFSIEDAAEVILSPASVNTNLNCLPSRHDALALISLARSMEALNEDDEHALIAAYNFLKHRAKAGVNTFGHWPTAHELDAVETNLRWASMLKRLLVMHGFPEGLRSIEQNLHRSLTELPVEVILSSIRTAVTVVATVVETIDPTRGQRLPRLARHAVDRALASSGVVFASNRAAVKHADGSVPLNDPLAAITPWAWLDPRPIAPHHLAQLSSRLQTLLTLRWGLDGSPPRTCDALAAHLGQTGGSITRLLARAERELRAIRIAENRDD